jgi:hypothetical protein
MSGTSDWSGVQRTNGFTTVVPESGVTLWRVPPASNGTIATPLLPERVYPSPSQTETEHGK